MTFPKGYSIEYSIEYFVLLSLDHYTLNIQFELQTFTIRVIERVSMGISLIYKLYFGKVKEKRT